MFAEVTRFIYIEDKVRVRFEEGVGYLSDFKVIFMEEKWKKFFKVVEKADTVNDYEIIVLSDGLKDENDKVWIEVIMTSEFKEEIIFLFRVENCIVKRFVLAEMII